MKTMNLVVLKQAFDSATPWMFGSSVRCTEPGVLVVVIWCARSWCGRDMPIDESDAATQRRQRRITLTEAAIRPFYQKCDPLVAAGTTVVAADY
jgi:hypothetical protein